jgi:hypothetical protein
MRVPDESGEIFAPESESTLLIFDNAKNTKRIRPKNLGKGGLGNNGYIMTKHAIDATGLDEDTYYPVTIDISDVLSARIEVYVLADGSSHPSWMIHQNGFDVGFAEEVGGNNWGLFNGRVHRRICLSDSSQWGGLPYPPVGEVGQMTYSSNEYIYVRGGGMYYFYVSHNCIPVLRAETYTIHEQTVSPKSIAEVNFDSTKRNIALLEDVAAVAGDWITGNVSGGSGGLSVKFQQIGTKTLLVRLYTTGSAGGTFTVSNMPAVEGNIVKVVAQDGYLTYLTFTNNTISIDSNGLYASSASEFDFILPLA